MRCRLLVEQTSKIIGAEVGIAQDAGEGAPADLPVQGNDERVPAPVFFKRTWLPR